MQLNLRPAESCRYDVVTLGEVMLRLDPGEERVRTTRTFHVREGGGEYNVGRALRRCFDHRVSHVTAIGTNDVAALLEDLLLQSGVNLDHVVRKDSDEVGRTNRTGLNFTERGFGVRAARGTYDRANSAAADLSPADVDWDHVFGALGARWFHTGGIFAGLSATTLEVTREALAAAKRHGTVVSYDINYRPSLWAAAGGSAAAERLTSELLGSVDVLLGVPPDDLEATATELVESTPTIQLVASPVRTVRSASRNDWGGVAWTPDTGLRHGRHLADVEILDRVGGGDAFAAGLIHGLLTERNLDEAIGLAVAHGALAMTTAGDTSSADAAEVERLAGGGDASAVR